MSLSEYVSHPYASREGVAHLANNPSTARSPEVLGTLASYHETLASHHAQVADIHYNDPSMRGDVAERAAFSSLRLSQGHAEAASILRSSISS